jgi:hypothetical protein
MKINIFFILFLGLQLNAYSQEIVGKQVVPCNSPADTDYIHPNRFISKTLINDTLELKFGIVRNCDFLPQIDLNLKNDSLLLTIVNGSNFFAACKCYMEINLQVIGIQDTNFLVYYNAESFEFTENGIEEHTALKEMKELPKFIFPTHEELNTIATTNQYYQDSLKIGLWLMDSVNQTIQQIKAFFYINESGESKAKWYVSYFENGQINEICASITDNVGRDMAICVEEEEYLRLMKSDGVIKPN